MEKNKTSKKVIMIGMLGAVVGLTGAILIYLLITAIMNAYHPIMTVMIYFGGYVGYIAVACRVKNKEKNIDENYNTVREKSKFYYETANDVLSQTEMIIGYVVSFIMGFFGIYIAEMLNLVYLIWKENKEIPLSEIFRYSLTGVFEEEVSKGYIYWGWIGAVVITIIVVIYSGIQKRKNQKNS